MTNANVWLEDDLGSGQADFYWQNGLKIGASSRRVGDLPQVNCPCTVFECPFHCWRYMRE